MHPVVQEYRQFPASSDALGDVHDNYRKCRLLQQLDEEANNQDVSQLLLAILRDTREYDLARVEAIKATGICVDERSPLHGELLAELRRIANDKNEDEMLQGWAQRYL